MPHWKNPSGRCTEDSYLAFLCLALNDELLVSYGFVFPVKLHGAREVCSFLLCKAVVGCSLLFILYTSNIGFAKDSARIVGYYTLTSMHLIPYLPHRLAWSPARLGPEQKLAKSTYTPLSRSSLQPTFLSVPTALHHDRRQVSQRRRA